MADTESNCDDNLNVNCPWRDEVIVEIKETVRAALYFDGTGNNKNNINLYKEKGIDRGDSYRSDYSNVARLMTVFTPHNSVDHSFSIYIEGIGTENEGKDDNVGKALGLGVGLGTRDTGITAKVGSGIEQLISKIDSLVLSRKIERLDIDVFGFSRGAAAARNFIYEAIQNEKSNLLNRLKKSQYVVGSVNVKFVGLFDTVASYGAVHKNDTADLNLNSVVVAERVVQLAAADEYRENFRLTNIKSAGNKLEIFLPGVHSDIGGGYTSVCSEDNMIIYFATASIFQIDSVKKAAARDIAWLINKGWYHRSEISTTDHIADNSYVYAITVNRKNIRNEYSYIPLHLMRKYASEYGSLHSGRASVLYAIPQDLQKVKAIIESYATKPSSSASDWADKGGDVMQELRHKYFHFSARYGDIGHTPQWTGNDEINGRRQRIIQDG